MRRFFLVGLVFGTCASAPAAASTTPEVCGADGCTSLPTATLVGLLTLPDALEPAEAPPSQPFILFDVTDLDGRSSRVVFVPHASPALLRFPGPEGWRRVPVDDAKLLVDAAATATPFPAPTTGRLRALFAADESSGSPAAWAALAAILCCALLVFAAAESRRRRCMRA